MVKGSLLVLFVGLALQGCKNMTNEQIIAERSKCLNAGMSIRIYQNSWTKSIEKVICVLQ